MYIRRKIWISGSPWAYGLCPFCSWSRVGLVWGYWGAGPIVGGLEDVVGTQQALAGWRVGWECVESKGAWICEGASATWLQGCLPSPAAVPGGSDSLPWTQQRAGMRGCWELNIDPNRPSLRNSWTNERALQCSNCAVSLLWLFQLISIRWRSSVNSCPLTIAASPAEFHKWFSDFSYFWTEKKLWVQ